MTREGYFEMCELMGSVPKESEIPVEFDDLITEVQHCVIIYNALQDNWEFVGGNYLGKNYTYLEQVFKMYGVEQELQRYYFDILQKIDRIRIKYLQDTKPKEK